jgi:hypothetical protein
MRGCIATFKAAVGIGGIDSYTKLMLHMASDFSDSELAPTKTFTAENGASIDSSTYKFAPGSGKFQAGSHQYLQGATTYSDFALGSQDFTIDTWFDFNGSLGNECIFSDYQSPDYYWAFGFESSGMFFYSKAGSFQIVLYSNGSFPSSGFHHIEIDRQGSNWYFFLDGTQIGSTQTNAASIGVNDLPFVGDLGNDNYYSYYLNHNIQELRISVGIARHTSNFTPPTSEYSLPGGPSTYYVTVSSGMTLSSSLASLRAVPRALIGAMSLHGGPIGVARITSGVTHQLRLTTTAGIGMSGATSSQFLRARTLLANLNLAATPRANFIYHKTITDATIALSAAVYSYRAAVRSLTGNMKLASSVSPHRILSRRATVTLFLKSSVQSIPTRFRTVTSNMTHSSTLTRQAQIPRSATGNVALSSTLTSKRILLRFLESNIALTSTLTNYAERAGALALKISVRITQRKTSVRVKQRSLGLQVKKREVKEEP